MDTITHAASRLLNVAGLAEHWRGRERFVVVATGCGAAQACLATWQAWRADPQRCRNLHVVAIDRDLPTRDHWAMRVGNAARSGDLRPGTVQASSSRDGDGRDGVNRDSDSRDSDDRAADFRLDAAGFGEPRQGQSPSNDLVEQLARAWPPLTPNLHRLVFEQGRVQWLIAPGDAADWLREIAATVDAFVMANDCDGRGLLVDRPRLAKALARLAAAGTTLVAASTSAAATSALQAAGFRVEAASGSGPDCSTRARYEPAYRPRFSTMRSLAAGAVEKRAVVIGAGLAGCATALALAEQGWSSVVVERRARIAAEASGNAAGLFHGIVNGQDGSHARFNRAAAIAARAAVATALADHGVAGAANGLLQLAETRASVTGLRELLARLGLPADYVEALSAAEASALAGLPLEGPTWFYPGGGWVDPAGLARSFIERAGARVEIRCDVEVAGLHRDESTWRLVAPDGRVVETATTVVLANAGDALRLCGGTWPVVAVRGQTSMLRAARPVGWQLPRRPITGSGYLLPEVDGAMMFGATADRDDGDPLVRVADHVRNLAQLARLAPSFAATAASDPTQLVGRTAWRWTSRDRLPLIGPVPLGLRADSSNIDEAGPRRDELRFVAREPGLYLYTALGSRGITWAALGGAVVAAAITGAPSPLESSLLDAVDPARFIVRDAQRASARRR